MYAMSDEESRVGVDLGVGRVPAWSGIQGSNHRGGLGQGGGRFKRWPGTVPGMQLEAFPEPPTSLPSSLCVACSLSHSFSSAKFIFSLLLPRSQDCRCTHVAWLPGQGGWGGWAGKGGFNFGGVRMEVSIPPQFQTAVSGASPPTPNTHSPGSESQIEA